MMRCRALRKAILILMIILLAASTLYAGGSKETVSKNELKKLYTGSEASDLMMSIADIFDEVTAMFCVSLTPFPNILYQFYSDSDDTTTEAVMENLELSDVLLTSDGYYNLENEGLTAGGISFQGTSTAHQKSAWNMITALFIAFFLAEVIFSAVYGYLTDKDGGVVKDIVTKTVITFLLFILTASLPFLIEAFRAGFYQMANTLLGLSDRVEAFAGKGSRAAMLAEYIEDATVFEYPGLLIRNMSTTMDLLNPGNLTGDGDISIWEATNTSGIGKLMIELVYLIVKLFGCFLSAFAALHVMMNVCEVYILLGATVCLIPFMVFSPTKWIGQGAIRSLISNTLELFVLIIIIFTSFTISDTFLRGISAALTQDVVYMSIKVTFSSMTAYLNVTGETYPETQPDEDTGITSGNTQVVEDQNGNEVTTLAPFYISLGDNGSGTSWEGGIQPDTSGMGQAGENSFMDPNIPVYFINAITRFFDAGKEVDADGNVKKPEFLQTLRHYFITMSPGKTPQEINTALSRVQFKNLPVNDKWTVIKAFQEANQNSFTVENMPENQVFGLSAAGSNNLFVIHIFGTLLIIFLQTYFVNQSSQIMNALLSGGVSYESFSSAMMRMATTRVSRVATSPARAAGAIVRGRAMYGDGWMNRVIMGNKNNRN